MARVGLRGGVCLCLTRAAKLTADFNSAAAADRHLAHEADKGPSVGVGAFGDAGGDRGRRGDDEVGPIARGVERELLLGRPELCNRALWRRFYHNTVVVQLDVVFDPLEPLGVAARRRASRTLLAGKEHSLGAVRLGAQLAVDNAFYSEIAVDVDGADKARHGRLGLFALLLLDALLRLLVALLLVHARR